MQEVQAQSDNLQSENQKLQDANKKLQEENNSILVELKNKTLEIQELKKENGNLVGDTELVVTFLDEMQNAVPAEALWYNIAKVESIHVQWTGTTPNVVKMYYTPSGTDMSEYIKLLLTKAPKRGAREIVLPIAEIDKTDMFGYLEIELDYGDRKTTSEFNVVYDTEGVADTEMSSVTAGVLEIFSRVYDYHYSRYKEGTTYAVNNLALVEHSQTEALVEVEIAKDGVVQWKRHHIRLQLVDGIWEITEVIGNEMVFAMNRIYHITNRDVSVLVEEDIKTSVIDSPYVGTIQSVVDDLMEPTEELQANFDYAEIQELLHQRENIQNSVFYFEKEGNR